MMKSCIRYANLFIRRNDSLLKCYVSNSFATKSSARSSKKEYNALDIRAKTNRENWEKEQEKYQMLRDKIPEDDVYFMKDYRDKYYSFKDAIQNFKDLCLDETLYNSPNSILEVNFILNMRTKKKTKFINSYTYITKLKNEISQIPPKNVIAFCLDKELANKLIEQGAYTAGGEVLVNKFLVGELNYEQFDTVICHPDMLPAMKKLKLLLRDKLPVTGDITVDTDLEGLLDKHKFGIMMKSKKLPGIPEEASVKLPLGPINWKYKHLQENLHVYINKFKEGKGFNDKTIMDLVLCCAPSPETFKVNLNSIDDVEDDPVISTDTLVTDNGLDANNSVNDNVSETGKSEKSHHQ